MRIADCESIGVSVVIPTWNGQHLLEAYLPSVMAAAQSYSQPAGAEAEIIVVDDGSTDETAQWLSTAYPHVISLRNERNQGFGPACNLGFIRAQHPVIVLLNNDVRVEPDMLSYLVRHFADASVFAVCCKALEPANNGVATTGKVGEFKHGFWRVYQNYDVDEPIDGHKPETRNPKPETRTQYYSILASGGFSAFSREKLRQLGGFNLLLAPFYWEDVELSLRAWKRGWKILYEPKAIVYHAASSTIESHFKPRQIEWIAQRNRLLTHWINLHDRVWMAKHAIMVGLLLLSALLTLNFTFWRAFLAALRKLPLIWRQRNEERRAAIVSDRELARLMATAIGQPWVQLLNR